MPQKRNPYALSMIRGTAGVLIGRLTGLLAVQKSPSARSDSLIMAYGEVPAMVDEARRTTELTAGVVETLTIDEARLRETLDAGFTPGHRSGRRADAALRARLPPRLSRRRPGAAHAGRSRAAGPRADVGRARRGGGAR